MAFSGANLNHMITCGNAGYMKQSFDCFIASQIILGNPKGRILPFVSIFGHTLS